MNRMEKWRGKLADLQDDYADLQEEYSRMENIQEEMEGVERQMDAIEKDIEKEEERIEYIEQTVYCPHCDSRRADCVSERTCTVSWRCLNCGKVYDTPQQGHEIGQREQIPQIGQLSLLGI